ncbi:rex-4, partial [Symbiodinium sp. CCMP2456]
MATMSYNPQFHAWQRYTGIDSVTFEAIRSGADPIPIEQMDLPKLVLPTAVAVAKVNALLDHVVIIGHDLRRDFHLLGRNQCRSLLRDTAFYPLLALGLSAKRFSGGLPSLRALAAEWLEDEKLHKGAHSSVEDARAAVLLYRLVKQEWDSFAEKKFGAPVWTAFPRRPRPTVMSRSAARLRLRRLRNAARRPGRLPPRRRRKRPASRASAE